MKTKDGFTKGDGYISLFVALLNLIALIYFVFSEGNIILLCLCALNLVSFILLGGNILEQSKGDLK